LTPDRAPDAGGWYNAPVTFEATGTDSGGSGIDECDEDETYSGPDSATASVAMSCLDVAGNSTLQSATFKYDDTAPAITITPSRPPDIDGAYNAPVTFTAIGSDSVLGSGAVECDDAVTYGG